MAKAKRKKGYAEVEDKTLGELSEALHTLDSLANDLSDTQDRIYREIGRIQQAFNKIGIDV